MFGSKRQDVARRDAMQIRELQSFNEPLEMHYPLKPVQKEISLFSRKNYTCNYVDNRKITVISNSVIFIKL